MQVDAASGEGFVSLIGGDGFDHSLETSFILYEGIIKGKIFRFRYRTLNVNGWSLYSPISYIRAASLPSRPPAPTFVTATANSFTLNLFQTTNDGGSEIQRYDLFRNQGGVSTEYTKVESYDGKST